MIVWQFDGSDLSEKVSADTQGGIYVAPPNDPTGASGAWVRQYDGPADIKWWRPTGDGVTDDRPAFQAAYDTLDDLSQLHISPAPTSYTLSTGITLSGTKRLYYSTQPGARWTSELDARKATGLETPSTAMGNFQRFDHFTDYEDNHGGMWLVSGQRPNLAPSVGYQWDLVRFHARTDDEGTGSGGGGAIACAAFMYGSPTQSNASMWGHNVYVYQPTGGDATMRGIEVNMDNLGTTQNDPTQALAKTGYLATTKSNHCSAAFFAGKGSGNGWSNAFYTNQDALVNLAASRAFKFDGLFEIHRDGIVEVGGGFAAGSSDSKRITTPANGVVLQSSRSVTTNVNHQQFYNPNGVVGAISTSGSSTVFNTSSDARLKENPRAFSAGSIIDSIDVWQFDWKSGGSGYGVFAQQCHGVFPQAITPGDEDLTQEEAKPWSADYSKFVPLLLAEIKALRARVAALEN